MNIFDMGKADFKNVRVRGWNEDVGKFDSLVIIPGGSRSLHDSGYRCIAYCLCRDGKPICLTGGGSDILHINGIGGYGKIYNTIPREIPVISWRIECLPKSGYLHLFIHEHELTCGPDLSSFEVFAETK